LAIAPKEGRVAPSLQKNVLRQPYRGLAYRYFIVLLIFLGVKVAQSVWLDVEAFGH
jgi:hypothetical protein